jgi:predicted Fe-Mo cluster-binding NifX family protein
MKIGICAKNNGLESEVADRFGRADNYVIFDTETKEVVTIENTAKNEASGAGGTAVKLLDKNKVEIVLAPELGPKAMDALRAFNIEAYAFGNSKTVKEAIENYENGKLDKFITNSTKSHHGLRKA